VSSIIVHYVHPYPVVRKHWRIHPTIIITPQCAGNSHVVMLYSYSGPLQTSPLAKVTVKYTSFPNPLYTTTVLVPSAFSVATASTPLPLDWYVMPAFSLP